MKHSEMFFIIMLVCVPAGVLSSAMALLSIPEFPRLGGIVLLRRTGALSMGTTRPAMNCDPATLCRFRRFAGYTGTTQTGSVRRETLTG